MALQILINLALALLWMFIGSNFTVPAFTTGYLLGLLSVYILRGFLPGSFYLKRVYAIIRLTFIFIIELIKSNIEVVKIVLRPKIEVKPAFFAYPCELEDEWAVSLLSALITLTPGTLVVAISDDRSILYIHALDIEDTESEIKSIKESFEHPIEEVKKA